MAKMRFKELGACCSSVKAGVKRLLGISAQQALVVS
jgi:hypothetical protein